MKCLVDRTLHRSVSIIIFKGGFEDCSLLVCKIRRVVCVAMPQFV